MSIPPDQVLPPDPPGQPSPDRGHLKKARVRGALVATAFVLIGSALAAASGLGALALGLGTVVAVLCVILGSILAIVERTRQFAVGFLIASAILIYVTAGACTVAVRFRVGMT